MKTANLSQIMKSAWSFFRITGECFSECLKRAWYEKRYCKVLLSKG